MELRVTAMERGSNLICIFMQERGKSNSCAYNNAKDSQQWLCLFHEWSIYNELLKA